jgi:short-subunit dehydrogenase
MVFGAKVKMEYTFISGATGGIGKAFAYSVAKRGGNLFLTGRSKNKLVALKEWITAKHPVKIIYFECDLTCEAERIKMIEFIRENDITFKRIINVAGVDTQKAFMQYTAEKLMFQLRVNVEATVHLTYELLKFKADKTEVITISSMSGQSPMPYFAVYSGTKALLTNLFTSLH